MNENTSRIKSGPSQLRVLLMADWEGETSSGLLPQGRQDLIVN